MGGDCPYLEEEDNWTRDTDFSEGSKARVGDSNA